VIRQLYDELQAVANLPLCGTFKKEVSVFEAIGSYLEEQVRRETSLVEKQSHLRTLEKLLNLEVERRSMLDEENSLLMVQLFKVLEEL
jgi:hypothetical protein